MKVTSSIVSDGESLNSGEHSGLWRKLELEKSMRDSFAKDMLLIDQILHANIFLSLSPR